MPPDAQGTAPSELLHKAYPSRGSAVCQRGKLNMLGPSRQPHFISEGSYTIRQHRTCPRQRHESKETRKYNQVSVGRAQSRGERDSDDDRNDAAAAGQSRRRMIRWLTTLQSPRLKRMSPPFDCGVLLKVLLYCQRFFNACASMRPWHRDLGLVAPQIRHI